MYHLSKVEKFYSEISAIRESTLSIRTDCLTVIVGRSGSGKSTLLRLLSFIEVPDRGEIELQIDKIRFSSNDDTLRPWPTVTCVFQKQFLWPHLSLRENISLPLRLRKYDRAREAVDEAVALLDMEDYIDRYPNEVSGGEAQRAALARALVLEPRVLLIDEAHTGLDVEQQEVLNGHLQKLRDRGVGLIIVSHSLEFAERFADEVVVIDTGWVRSPARPGSTESPLRRFREQLDITGRPYSLAHDDLKDREPR